MEISEGGEVWVVPGPSYSWDGHWLQVIAIEYLGLSKPFCAQGFSDTGSLSQCAEAAVLQGLWCWNPGQIKQEVPVCTLGAGWPVISALPRRPWWHLFLCGPLDLPVWSSLQVHDWQSGHPGGLAEPQHHPLCREWQVVHRPSCDHPGKHANPVQHHDPERRCVRRGPLYLLCADGQPPQDLPRPPHRAGWVNWTGCWCSRQRCRGHMISPCASTSCRKTQKAIPLQNPETECILDPFHLYVSWLSAEDLHRASQVYLWSFCSHS